MITGATKHIPELQGLILIDCWDPGSANSPSKISINQFYKNIIKSTAACNFVCVINSGNHILLDLEDHSFSNLFYHHCNNDLSRLPEYLLQRHNRVIANSCRWSGRTNLNTGLSPNYSSKLLHDHFFTQGRGIYIMDPLDLVFHNQLILSGQVKNWLVAGRSWQVCVHDNHLGLNNLAELAERFNLNFYATDYSFLKPDNETTATQADFDCDELEWEIVTNFGYRLVPSDRHRQYAEIIAKYPYA